MNLKPDIMDNPTAKSSIALTIHESLHAGNYNTVKDVPGAYNDGSKRFREVSEANKLRNADHYTVIAWRELVKNDKRAHPRKTFTPVVRRIRGRTRIGAASLIAIKEGSKKAMQTLTSAVSNAMTLHDQFRKAYNTPSSWNLRISHRSVPRNAGYSNTLPYWSKVERLTIHKRPNISQYTSDPSRKPVSTTDLAISEGVVRRLNLTRNYIWDNPAKTLSFINKYASSRVWKRARRSIPRKRDLISRRILRHKVRNIAGSYNVDFSRMFL
jgi:hypothetical protein